MKYKIVLTKSARKAYLKLPSDVREAVYKKLMRIAQAPYFSWNNVTRLKGVESAYRLRVRNYRVLYRILDKTFLIEVIRVGHRREVYR